MAGAMLLTPAVAFAADGDGKGKSDAKLSGANEVPGPGDVNGKGKFTAKLTDTTMCYTLKVKKIDAATAAHVHQGDAESAGPVVITLTAPQMKKVKECLTAVPDAEDTEATMSESELAGLHSAPNGYYVNVHTADFPAGAVRGQLR